MSEKYATPAAGLGSAKEKEKLRKRIASLSLLSTRMWMVAMSMKT
jgi:hypothetical protein|tara:strand:+ start:955 stop:1089 length:135 start_codon:yes stop_codon:yes gene_type:complete